MPSCWLSRPLWRSPAAHADDTPHCPRPCPDPSDRLLKPLLPTWNDTQAAGGMSSPPWAGAPGLLQTVRGAITVRWKSGSPCGYRELLAPRGDAVLTLAGEAGPLQPGEHGDQAPPGPCKGRAGAEPGAAEFPCGGACPHSPCLARLSSVPCEDTPALVRALCLCLAAFWGCWLLQLQVRLSI